MSNGKATPRKSSLFGSELDHYR